MTLTFGSLFTGIGGFDLGFEQAGMACQWQVEIDAACQGVLQRHWPNVRRYQDVRTVGRDNLAPVDLICGGFPCQDLSVAGRRAGLAGERSGLWFEFRRVLAELRPDWVVIENVPGLLSSKGGRDFAVLLSGLVELGYGVAWRILDALYFGVPQRRRRVFIVGHLGDGRAAEVLFEREGGPGDTPPSRAAGTGVAAFSSKGFGGYGTGAGTIRAEGGDIGGVSEILVIPALTATLNSGGNNGGFRTELGEHLVVFDWQSGGDMRLNCSMEHTSALQTRQTPAVSVRNGVRRLMPIECERLQAFPDGWTAEGLNGPQSDSTRYRQLGNAVCVNVIRWLGHRIVGVSE